MLFITLTGRFPHRRPKIRSRAVDERNHMFGKRTLRVAAIGAAVALPLSVAVASPAAAADPKPAQVSVLHGIPGLTVDVCAGDKVLIPGFTPGTLAGPLALPAATYDLGVQPTTGAAAGADCAPDTYALKASVAVAAGKNYTITANLTATGAPALNVFTNNKAAVTKFATRFTKSTGRVTVRHIAAAPAVDVFVNGNVAIAGLTNPNQAQTRLKKGTYQVAAGLAGAGAAGIALGPVPLEVKPGFNAIVYAWGVPQSVPGGAGVQVAVQYVKLSAPKKR
jgi:hypothetical protein